MGTKVLTDIHNDLKLLITSITNLKSNEEGFRLCERQVLSHIKHHRYLSVDSHATKETIGEVIKKFSIHGKYGVAKKFQELVELFLTSFNFEHHPQYDLHWSLLTLLLDLSSETHKSELNSLKASIEHSFNAVNDSKEDVTEEIDWAHYLKETEEEFFYDYKTDSESDWSDDADKEAGALTVCTPLNKVSNLYSSVPAKLENLMNKLSLALTMGVESTNWLLVNVQHTWWHESALQKYPVKSQYLDANLCEIWQDFKSIKAIGTISEYQACRELLWMFHVLEEMVIFRYRRNRELSVCQSISIPSLTITAFVSILSPFCKCFAMMHKLEEFGSELHSENDNSPVKKKPSLTYEAYNVAIQQHLTKYKSNIVNIEKNVMKQDTSNTLLYLSQILQQYLLEIETIYDIHQRSVSNWKKYSNWECASKLLSELYFEMQTSRSHERTSICADLYLASLTVYLNIIDTWLSEGRLEDWRDEFIITRITENQSSKMRQHESFTIRKLNATCLMDPIMQLLIRKLQQMGHSIELLVSLDRIADMWQTTPIDYDKRVSLNDEFYSKLVLEISKYSSSELMENIPETASESRNLHLEKHDVDVDKNITHQLSMLDNPFLLKAFEDCMPSNLYKKDIGKMVSNIYNMNKMEHNVYAKLKALSVYILPYRKILENTFVAILDSRYNSAAKLVKSIMVNEYKLEMHLKLMRSVYMMESGHIMSRFYNSLFHEIETNQVWSNSYFLSCTLEEVLSQEWPDSNSRWSITVEDVNTHLVLQAIERITLHYAVDWPISIVLDETALNKYNKIFRFQLKLKWALWTLNNLRFSDLEGPKSACIRHEVEHFQIRRLESLRFWLLHAIGSIQAYLSGQVLQSLRFALDNSLKQADSLDTIISVHNEYLEKVEEHCLLTTDFEDIMATINNLIEMCSHIRHRWDRTKLLLATSELGIMENSYIKYHTYLTLALHNAIQDKDANYRKCESFLTTLCSLFRWCCPGSI